MNDADLKNLASGRLVAVVAHVVAVVWRRGSEAKDVTENTDDSQQTLHLSFVTAGQTEQFVSIGCSHFSQTGENPVVMRVALLGHMLQDLPQHALSDVVVLRHLNQRLEQPAMMLDQDLTGLSVPALNTEVQRCDSVLIREIFGSSREKDLSCVSLAVTASKVKRCGSGDIGSVDVGATVQKTQHRRFVSVLAGHVQRGLSHSVLYIYIRHVLNQVMEELSATVHRQPVNCSEPLVVADVDVSVVLQQFAHALLLTVPGSEVKRGAA